MTSSSYNIANNLHSRGTAERYYGVVLILTCAGLKESEVDGRMRLVSTGSYAPTLCYGAIVMKACTRKGFMDKAMQLVFVHLLKPTPSL